MSSMSWPSTFRASASPSFDTSKYNLRVVSSLHPFDAAHSRPDLDFHGDDAHLSVVILDTDLSVCVQLQLRLAQLQLVLSHMM